MTRDGGYLTPRQQRRLSRAVSLIERQTGDGGVTPFGREVFPTLAFADEQINAQDTGLATFATTDYFSPTRGSRRITVYNLTNNVVSTDELIAIEYYNLEQGGGAWVYRVGSPATKIGCPRDPIWTAYTSDPFHRTTTGLSDSLVITNLRENLLPLYLREGNGVFYDRSTGDFTTEVGYYRIAAQVQVIINIPDNSLVSVWAYIQDTDGSGLSGAQSRSEYTFSNDSGVAQGYTFVLHINDIFPPNAGPTFRLVTGWSSKKGSITVSATFTGQNVLITRLINCTQAESPPVPIGPGDLCDFTTTAYFWQSESNYSTVSGTTKQWSVSDLACTSGVTWEQATATAPDDTSNTINSIATLTFGGSGEHLDIVGATELEVSDTATIKEMWLSFKFTRIGPPGTGAAGDEAFTGDSAGANDFFGRNEYGYLEMIANGVASEFGKLCLADDEPHVLRIENTGTNGEYRVTLDNYYTHTIDNGTADFVVDRLGEDGSGNRDLECQIMDLYFCEALDADDEFTTWEYLMENRINASATIFSEPVGDDSTLNDLFLTPDASPVTTPRTCEPGPGTLTWDTGDESGFDITGGQLVLTTTGSATPTSGFTGDSQTRQAGLRMECRVEMSDGAQESCYIGWMSSTTTADSSKRGGLQFSNDINSHLGWAYHDGTGNYVAEFPGFHTANASEHFIAVVLRANGYHVFAEHCGQLRHIMADHRGSTATLYPGLINGSGNFALDYFRVRGSTWQPTPLWSDSFTRANSDTIGAADDAGAEETGGQTPTWTEVAVNTGNAQIVSNALVNSSTTAGDQVFVITNDTGQTADVMIEATLLLSDWAAVVFNYVNSSNYWFLSVAADDGAGTDFTGSSGAGNVELYEVVSGTETRRGNASTPGSMNKGDTIRVWVHAYDDTVACEAVEDGGLASMAEITYRATDRPNKSGYQHGLYLDNEVTSNPSSCTRFVCWPINVSNYV